MQTKVVKAFEARRNFGRVLTAVGIRGNQVVVTKNGERLAAIVPIEIFDRWQKERAAFFASMRRTAKKANLSEDDALRLASEAVQAIRAQKRGAKA